MLYNINWAYTLARVKKKTVPLQANYCVEFLLKCDFEYSTSKIKLKTT